jgi:hypothetical protein
MTADIGRLLLVEPGFLGGPDDSRDCEGPPTGVLNA